MTASGRLSPVDDATGLIRWVSDIPVEPGEPAVFNASVKMAETTVYNPQPCYDNNGGSGFTREQARGSAIGEGLERYCCSVYAAEDLVRGSVEELRRCHRLVPADDFALYHPEQEGGFPPPPPDAPQTWTWSWSLARSEPVLLPASLVYMPYFPASPGERVSGPAVSTGLSCAPSADEATLRGICEVVERDAFMIVWSNVLSAPRVDIESDPEVRAAYEQRLRRDGLEYLLVRTTSDIPLPSFLCLMIDHRRRPALISAGGATDLHPARAALKAMTEAVQTREWAKFLGGGAPPDYCDVRDFEDHVRLYAYGDMLDAIDFLRAGPEVGLHDGVSVRPAADPRRDLCQVLEILADLGLDVYAVDLTTVDVEACGYRVVRAVLPELQPLDADHQHRFLGGRRLYEVPHRLGLTTSPTSLASLNPRPHPYP